MPRYSGKRDIAESPIVKALRKAGYTVEHDGEVDLLVRHSAWTSNIWVKLECKTKRTKKPTMGFRPRKDQQDQTDYCLAHCIPYVITPEQALQYLKEFSHRAGLYC